MCDASGNDFTEEGFASVIEYLYTGAVVGVTCGILDCDKLQATLQAAQYFNLTMLDKAARSWAQQLSAITGTSCVWHHYSGAQHNSFRGQLSGNVLVITLKKQCQCQVTLYNLSYFNPGAST
jgi:hypothetical protein